MKISVTSERTDDGKVAAKVTVPAAEVDAAVKKTYRDIAHRYNFQGFRRGRAPRPVIDGIVGKAAVLAQATDELLQEVQPQMIEELDLVPVERPDWGESDPVVEHEDFMIECTVVVPPVATLKSYEAPAINMPPAEVTEAEIDNQIDQLLAYRTSFEPNKRAKKVKAKDMITVTATDKKGESGIAGEDRTLSMSNPNLAPELVSEMVGMKVGESKTISWTHEHGDHSHEFEVEVTINTIQKAVTPKLTDEFAKTGFGFENIAELRDAVKEEVEADKKQSLPGLKEDRVVAAIGEQLDLDEIPESYQNQVFNELVQEFLGQLSRQGLNLDMYLQMQGIKSDEFLADLHDQAEERARQSLALDALATELQFEVSDEDIRSEFVKANVEDVDGSIKEFIAEGRMPAVRQSIRRTKAVTWLVDNAQVTEVDEIAEARAKNEKDSTGDAAEETESAPETADDAAAKTQDAE